jgi:hypothetical protein
VKIVSSLCLVQLYLNCQYCKSQTIKRTYTLQAEFEKFGEIISASISQGTRKKFPKKKPAAAEAEKKEENGDKEGETAANDDKKEDATAVVTDDEGEKKEAADGECLQ